MTGWHDLEDAPVITREIAERGEWRLNGELVKSATGTLTQLQELISQNLAVECFSKPLRD